MRFMALDEELLKARADRWLRRVSTLPDAVRYVGVLGFVLLFPADRIEAPSLWEAVAGEDVEPFANGMNEDETKVWEWKDELPLTGGAWYGKYLFRRGSLLAPDVVAALYPGRGRDVDHRALDLSREAHDVAEALRGGPMPTTALRQLVGNRARYERAVGELHRCLLVTVAGVHRQGSGWPASVLDLTYRHFAVGKGADPNHATARYLDTMGQTTVRVMARALGWPVPLARTSVNALVGRGVAVRQGKDLYAVA
jgi:hypothetical protein